MTLANNFGIQNYNKSTDINFNSDPGIKVLWSSGIHRDMTKHGEDVDIVVLKLHITGTDASTVRSNLNALSNALVQAVEWNENKLEADSFFYADTANGEEPTRRLILDYKLSGINYGSTTPYQANGSYYATCDLALTLQNKRERILRTNVTLGNYSPTLGDNSFKFTVSGHDSTALSRCLIQLTGESGGPTIEDLHIGFREYNGSSFVHEWNVASTISDAAFDALAGAWSAGSTTTVASLYSSANEEQARGQYVAVLNYTTGGSTGNIYCRFGTASSALDGWDYNEQKLLDPDKNAVSLGIFSVPGYGYRQETQDLSAGFFKWNLSNFSFKVSCQRLTGDRSVTLNHVTFVPYDHYLHITDTAATNLKPLYIIQHEDWSITSFSSNAATPDETIWKRGIVVHQHNFGIPRIKNTYVQGVIASSTSTITAIDEIEVFEAFTGYAPDA